MAITQVLVDSVIGIVKARYMDNVAVVAMADGLANATRNMTTRLERQRQQTIPNGVFRYPHSEIEGLLGIAKEQVIVTTLYDILAVALQRLGEEVER